MAIIYGRADSEKQLLDLYPKKVQEIDDIDKVEEEMQEELMEEAKDRMKRLEFGGALKSLEMVLGTTGSAIF